MLIRMEHPLHGATNVYSLLDAEEHEKLGWVIDKKNSEAHKQTPVETPVEVKALEDETPALEVPHVVEEKRPVLGLPGRRK